MRPDSSFALFAATSTLALLAALAATPAARAETVRCESIEGRSTSCDLPGTRGVALERQLGGSACVFGRNWNWDGRRVRVEENCRGEFRNSLERFAVGRSLECESDHGRAERCPADTRAGVLFEEGDRNCAHGTSWGFDRAGVWVDDGCEASFRVAIAPISGRPIRCDWIEGGPRRFCPVDTSGGVLLEKSFGSAECVFGTSWGLIEGGVWVDRGCSALLRADSLASSGSFGSAPVEIACASVAGGTNFCPAPSVAAVELLHDSSARCVEKTTWSFNAHGVTVEDGCTGLFRVKH